MKDTCVGLFASHIALEISHLSPAEPKGFYDASEQLWRDDGEVVAEGWQ